jgi:hypothetical protein
MMVTQQPFQCSDLEAEKRLLSNIKQVLGGLERVPRENRDSRWYASWRAELIKVPHNYRDGAWDRCVAELGEFDGNLGGGSWRGEKAVPLRRNYEL